jgi:hypothetical protein
MATLLLQLAPYSLAGGAGVNMGIAAFANPVRTGYQGARIPFLRIPYESVGDAGWIYLLSVPMFAVASLFEFTVRVL